jgi:hypothetical protein
MKAKEHGAPKAEKQTGVATADMKERKRNVVFIWT